MGMRRNIMLGAIVAAAAMGATPRGDAISLEPPNPDDPATKSKPRSEKLERLIGKRKFKYRTRP